MKRLLCVVLCVLLAVAVVGCGAPEAEPSESAEASATVEPTPIATPTPTPTPTPEPTVEGVVNQEGALGELTFIFSSISEPTITDDNYSFFVDEAGMVSIEMMSLEGTDIFDDEEANNVVQKTLLKAYADGAIKEFDSGSTMQENYLPVPGAKGDGYWIDYAGELNGVNTFMSMVSFNTDTATYHIMYLAPVKGELGSSTEKYMDFLKTVKLNGVSIVGEEDNSADNSTDNAVAETTSQSNAVRKAKEYLDFMAFSREGLIEQLEYEGFSNEDATYGADNSGADWMEQAAKAAESYLDVTSFSRQGLIEQLEYEGFTEEQAVHGADSVGI